MGPTRTSLQRRAGAALLIAAAATAALAAPPPAATGDLEAPEDSARAPVEAPYGLALHYHLSIASPSSPRAEITIRVSRDARASRPMRFHLVDRFSFVRLDDPLIEEPVRAFSGDREILVVRTGAREFEIDAGAAPEFEIRYAVSLRHREQPSIAGRDEYEYPYVAADHGMLATAALLLTPAVAGVPRMRVSLDLPTGWGALTPWEETGRNVFEVGDPRSLQDDLIAIGAWTSHEESIGAFRFVVAFAPGQDSLRARIVKPLGAIVRSELDLFGLRAGGRYLFLFGRPDGHGVGGSPRTRSMTLFAEPALVDRAPHELARLVAHEFFHTWGRGRIEFRPELRWLAEGFADFYSEVILGRLGISSWEEVARRIGARLVALDKNPARSRLSLIEAGGDAFFEDPNAFRLTYDRGFIVAVWLDAVLRARSLRLDDLMRTFMNDPRWRPGQTVPTLEDFIAIVEGLAGSPTAGRLRELVSQPGTLDAARLLADENVPIERGSAPSQPAYRVPTRALD